MLASLNSKKAWLHSNLLRRQSSGFFETISDMLIQCFWLILPGIIMKLSLDHDCIACNYPVVVYMQDFDSLAHTIGSALSAV